MLMSVNFDITFAFRFPLRWGEEWGGPRGCMLG